LYNRERVTTERPDKTIEETSGEIPVATVVGRYFHVKNT
jgi:hypothetical protein